MSDTPRTDCLELPAQFWNGLVAPADFARSLERKLAAARAELARAMKVVEAVEAAMCIEVPKPLRDAMQREWDEEAGR